MHIDKISRGDGIRGYEAGYRSWFYRFHIPRRLYVVPSAGTAASGQPIVGDLLAALQATGTATSVTRLRTRPYGASAL